MVRLKASLVTAQAVARIGDQAVARCRSDSCTPRSVQRASGRRHHRDVCLGHQPCHCISRDRKAAAGSPSETCIATIGSGLRATTKREPCREARRSRTWHVQSAPSQSGLLTPALRLSVALAMTVCSRNCRSESHSESPRCALVQLLPFERGDLNPRHSLVQGDALQIDLRSISVVRPGPYPAKTSWLSLSTGPGQHQ